MIIEKFLYRYFLGNGKLMSIMMNRMIQKIKILDGEKNAHRKSQVDLFFGIKENQEIDNYFWIFLPDFIYAIKLIKPFNVLDFAEIIPDYLSNNEGSIPKFYNGFLKKRLRFDKKDLPESFSNINANQKFNRKTIVEFDGKEKIMANHLIFNSGGMTISEKERLSHLSPVQFETLIFLIFVQNNIYCSTYRGGTKEKYDLLIDNKKEVFSRF